MAIHLGELSNAKRNLVIAGDFNMPDVKWPNPSKTFNSPSSAYIDSIHNNNLFQLIDFPTRFCGSQNPSLLDLVLTNDTDLISKIEQCPPLGKSDHIILMAPFICIFQQLED